MTTTIRIDKTKSGSALEVARISAIYLCQYQGQRGTAKQVEKILSLGAGNILRMAEERGLKIEQK